MESNIYMTIVKLYLFKSNYKQMYIHTNENYIKFNENPENLYYDIMKIKNTLIGKLMII